MRPVLASTLSLAALVLLAASGAAHLGEVAVEPEPVAEDPWCVPVCEVQTTRSGNVPPVTVVESGANVTWTVLEGGYHTATSNEPTRDTASHLLGSSTVAGCMDAQIFTNATVAFRLNGTALEVLHQDREDPSWQPCPEAIRLADGSMLLSYHCNVHPRFQHGAVLVTPAT